MIADVFLFRLYFHFLELLFQYASTRQVRLSASLSGRHCDKSAEQRCERAGTEARVQ